MIETLFDALSLLAADADRQIAALPAFVVVTDELALLYDDQVRLHRMRAHGLPASEWAAVEALDATLLGMSSVPALWNNDALAQASEWAKVRAEARRILAELGRPVTVPVLPGVHYVGGPPPA
jgi:hypothetical protein